jgi:hypothetical protein
MLISKYANPFLLILLILLSIFSVLTLTVQDFLFKSKNISGGEISSTRSSQISIISSSEEKKKITEAVSEHFYTGNIAWNRYIDDWSYQAKIKTTKLPIDDKERDFSYPFSGLSTFTKKPNQSWIGGLECPIVDEYRSSKEQEKALKFSCLPQYLSEARKYFDVFSLANNHTDNMEEVNGLEKTRNFLSDYKFQYFGHFDNAVKQDICEIISLPIEYIENSENKTTSFPFALCGYHNVFKLPTKEELAVMKDYSKHFITISMPHQGAEYRTKSDNIQKNTFRSMIDNGADMVISDHPHTTQELEEYKGKLIAHSLGNFIFDQQGNYEVTHAIALSVKFNLKSHDLQFYIDFNKNNECSKYKDNCLKKAQEMSLKKVNFTPVFEIKPVDLTDKKTKLGDSEVLNFMLKRTNFEEVNKKLKY